MTAPEKCPKCGDKTVPKNAESTVTFYFCGSDYDKVFWQSTKCTVRERDALRAANAELEARLAASVTRDVALLAASICFDACYEDMGEENSKTVEQTLAGAKPYPLGSRVHQITVLALARAEAEAAKPQTDKEPDNG